MRRRRGVSMRSLSAFPGHAASPGNRIRQSRHRSGHGTNGLQPLRCYSFLTRRLPMNTQTFFITGVSSGFGQALSREALSAGHRVIGTVRNEEARRAFEALHDENAHAVLLDVTDIEAIPGA